VVVLSSKSGEVPEAASLLPRERRVASVGYIKIHLRPRGEPGPAGAPKRGHPGPASAAV
jgi:hypothetical protein